MPEVEIKLTGCLPNGVCDFSNREGEVFVVTCQAGSINQAKLSPPELIKLARFLFKQPTTNGDGSHAQRSANLAVSKNDHH